MSYLLDTNVAIRCIMPSDPQYAAIRTCMLRLIADGERFVIFAQVLSESWSLLTRPAQSRGGYGFTTEEADAVVADITTLAELLPEPPDIWKEQHRMLVKYAVSGVQTHDCRIAAWCHLHGVDAILTLNTADFARYGIRSEAP